jgi:hypothetical protein
VDGGYFVRVLPKVERSSMDAYFNAGECSSARACVYVCVYVRVFCVLGHL